MFTVAVIRLNKNIEKTLCVGFCEIDAVGEAMGQGHGLNACYMDFLKLQGARIGKLRVFSHREVLKGMSDYPPPGN